MDSHISLLILTLCAGRLQRIALKCDGNRIPPEPFDCESAEEYNRMVGERHAAIRELLPDWRTHGQILEIVEITDVIVVPDGAA